MEQLIDRREALRKTALLMGAAVSASALAGIMQGCKATPELTYTPSFFTEEQARIMSELAQTIIPKTNTPGAKEAGVPGFIDQILKECYKKEDQDKFIAGLTEFEAAAKAEHGDSFIYLDAEKQLAFVKAQNEAAVNAVKADPSQPRPFILSAKELTLLGFFTSEPGATQVLQYEAVPGSYKGCIPLTEAGNGKTWAT
ncbi:MAG: twin-arginine translocation pathway signal [Bacteroidetes bacterium OLB12]|nr:MAG: twin-arginine translocation pathway signal [Bacteroidetes bacterium OLB12]HNR74860.1 gluconate 2-dehydrogenase subunit 3 family protein [Cyclobacteriaceae bacterium]